jgi:hypothetical protein
MSAPFSDPREAELDDAARGREPSHLSRLPPALRGAPPSALMSKGPWQGLLWGSLVGAMLLGAWMRWALAGAVDLALPLHHVRHAHSHVGYYGLLFPLAWLGWSAAGARAPGRGAMLAYTAGTAVACVGFLRSGYGPVAIAASTFIAGFWLWSAASLVSRMRRPHDPLGVVPLGTLACLGCVPPIALHLRSHPELAHGFVSTFLSGLLLLVVIPSALAARRISPCPWPVLLLLGALGALYLGVAPQPITRGGLLAYAGMMLAPALSPRLDWYARAPWGLVGLGLGAMAVGVLPNARPVALGAIHFLILGPVLSTLAPLWLKRSPPAGAWWLGHAAWGTMSAALVSQGFVASTWTWRIAALGGTATLLWWAWALSLQRVPRGDGPAPG